MNLVRVYQCFCDQTRLRILHLLLRSPLCVCHFQRVLREPQVKISKHLAYLREHGLVEARRHENWMIYQLPSIRTVELEANLKCLQDCVQTEPAFKKDKARLDKLMDSRDVTTLLAEGCCPSASPLRKKSKCS